MSDGDRYEELLALEADGRELPPDEATFMRYFESTDRYRRDESRYAALRLTLAGREDRTRSGRDRALGEE
jgi:hypothetical protein